MQGIQGETGVKGDKGDDGYPFLIYKQYDSIDDFNPADFPEIGLMFMVNVYEDDNGYPIYRYTGDGNYSLVTHMNTDGIKGEKGDKGDKGDTGDKGSDGLNGADGTTYTPSVKFVQTLDSNASAAVSVEINEENKTAEFSFSIPKGRDGIDGQDGKEADMSRVEALETKVNSFTSGWKEWTTVISDGSKIDYSYTADTDAEFVVNWWCTGSSGYIYIHVNDVMVHALNIGVGGVQATAFQPIHAGDTIRIRLTGGINGNIKHRLHN